jgi:hypothetical protein
LIVKILDCSTGAETATNEPLVLGGKDVSTPPTLCDQAEASYTATFRLTEIADPSAPCNDVGMLNESDVWPTELLVCGTATTAPVVFFDIARVCVTWAATTSSTVGANDGRAVVGFLVIVLVLGAEVGFVGSDVGCLDGTLLG